jgi:hypothetical protein
LCGYGAIFLFLNTGPHCSSCISDWPWEKKLRHDL